MFFKETYNGIYPKMPNSWRRFLVFLDCVLLLTVYSGLDWFYFIHIYLFKDTNKLFIYLFVFP